MNGLITYKNKSLSARLSAWTGSDQFRWLAWCALLAAAVWWLLLPAWIGTSGERVQVRVVETWQSGWYITLFIYETRLTGTRLEITLPDGGTRQIRKYCGGETVAEGPVRLGALLEGRYSRLMPWRLVLPDSACDAPVTWLIGLSLLSLGGYMTYRWHVRGTAA